MKLNYSELIELEIILRVRRENIEERSHHYPDMKAEYAVELKIIKSIAKKLARETKKHEG